MRKSTQIIYIVVLLLNMVMLIVNICDNRKLEKENAVLTKEVETLNDKIDDYNENEYFREKITEYLVEFGDIDIEEFELWLYQNHREWYLKNAWMFE